MKMEENLKSASVKDKEGKEIRYSVEQIENGWILIKDASWKDPKGNYQYKCTKKFFEENPLDEQAILSIDKLKKQ